MKIHPAPQGSLEWQCARAGLPTASEFDQLLTPDWKVRTGEMPRTYLFRKLSEWWTGTPAPSFQGFDMEQGQILEDRALPWFELEHNCTIDRVGLCLTDDGLVGASPDGLIGDDAGIECKCPTAAIHCRYLLDGVLPKEYTAQVHGCMYVTGRSEWKFVSYHRRFPKLVLTIKRSEKVQDAIAEALHHFNKGLADAKERLTAINGGPPFRPTPTKEPEPEPETCEIIP